MADVMMALGDYRFSIDTAALQSIREVHAWRWADHNLTGASHVRSLLVESYRPFVFKALSILIFVEG